MIVRPAKERDRSQVVEMGRMLTDEMRPNLEYDETRARAGISRFLTGDNSMWFVCEGDRELVGFLVAFRTNYLAHAGFFISQEIFYVRPDKRGTRAAAKLFAEFNRWADSQHPQEVYAGIATGHRSDLAARWMRRFGFEPVGPHMRRLAGG